MQTDIYRHAAGWMDTFSHIKRNEDYLADPSEHPWKEILNLLPKNLEKFIHVSDVTISIRCEAYLPLTADDKTAEEFMRLALYLNKIQPYLQQQATTMVIKTFGNAENIENYWSNNKDKLRKPQPYTALQT